MTLPNDWQTIDAIRAKLPEFSIKHVHNMIAYLRGGSMGHDPFRSDLTKTKVRAIETTITEGVTPARIHEAHLAAINKYRNNDAGSGGYGAGAGSGGANSGGGSGKASEADTSSDAGSTEAEADEGKAGDNASETGGKANEGKGENNSNGNSNSNSNSNGNSNSNSNSPLEDMIRRIAREEAGKLDTAVVEKTGVFIRDLKTSLTDQIAEAVKNIRANGAGGNGGGAGVNVVRLERRELPPMDCGVQHKNFPLLLKACNARMRDGSRLNIWLRGPAGTGKTTAAANVAKALELPFYATSALDTAYELVGFRDGMGNYQPTAFRQAWEHGGVFLFDEIDASSSQATTRFNQALANGLMPFPDKAELIPRHADCIIIAGANTGGLGATTEYVGRTKQDAATLDRFIDLDWPIDEALERAICGEKDWVRRVQKVRANVKARGVRGVMVTPRASIYGEALIAAGLTTDEVEAMVLRKSAADDVWQQIKGA